MLLPKCKIKVAIESVILSVAEVLLQVVGAKPSSEATKGSRRGRLRRCILLFIRLLPCYRGKIPTLCVALRIRLVSPAGSGTSGICPLRLATQSTSPGVRGLFRLPLRGSCRLCRLRGFGFASLVSPAGSVASGENDTQSFSNTLGFASLRSG